jgi:RNA polymerase sigma factor (sigma-70 family)
MVEREKLISLVKSLQAGEEDAFTQLYDAFYESIYYHILKTVKEPELAADLTQDTFMEVLETIHKLEEPAAFVTWAKQIAYHRCTAYFRKTHELLADEDEDGYSVFDTIQEDRAEFIPGEALDKEDLKNAIRDMIDSLPPEQRSALMMRYFEEISVKEIAEIQGVTEGTVKSRLNYARKAVKQSVEDYEKKHGIKLHCVGIVPLLLWFFRVSRRSGAAFGAAGTATAAATTVATTTTAATATAAAAGAGSTASAVAGTSLAAKIVAGVLAASLAIGGTTAVVANKDKLFPAEPSVTRTDTAATTQTDPDTDPDIPDTPQPSTPSAPQEPAEPEFPRLWVGYGEYFYSFNPNRYEFEVYEMDNTQLTGRINIENLYSPIYKSDLSGTGTVNEDGTIHYVLQMDTPLQPSGLSSFVYTEMEVDYDPQTQAFSLSMFDVVTHPADQDDTSVIVKDRTWAGDGECTIYTNAKNFHYEINIHELTSTTVSGHITLSRNGALAHSTEFTGRGHVEDGASYYEIKLADPHTVEYWFTSNTIECFWMGFRPETGIMKIDSLYAVTLEEVTNVEPEPLPDPDFGPPSQGLEYTLSHEGTYYALSSIGNCTETDIVVATEYNGLPVKEILPNAFRDKKITSVSIPYGITTIHGAFDMCTSLERIYIPASVTQITSNPLAYCSSLTSITVAPDNPAYRSSGNCLIEIASKTLLAGSNNSVIPADGSVEIIGNRAFSHRKIQSLVIPDGVTVIEDYAFFGCSELVNITMADSVTSIGNQAFLDCGSLESFTVPAGTTTLGPQVFTYCESLVELKVAPGNPVFYSQGNCIINRNTNTLVFGCPTSVIPDDGSITAIGDYAFADVIISQVSIPQGVTKIGSFAFYCCYAERIDIPDTLTEIEENAFQLCYVTDFYYSGTMAQWQTVTKVQDWDAYTEDYVVHCTDGDIPKS